ncbi:MAG: TetR/AcrR family transcriptional regulator [Acidobacteriota bacterium]
MLYSSAIDRPVGLLLGGSTSPRPDVSKERTQQILEAAMKVFSRAGFQKASMDDIVAESGLSKGALYWYFKSKDEIIAGILDYLFARELADIRALPEAEGSAHDRLLRFAQFTLAEIRQMTRLLPITYEFYTLALRNKTVQRVLKKYLANYLAGLIPVIEQGMARGEFRKMDARQVSISFGAIVEGALLLWVFDPKLVNLEAQIESGIQLLLAGLERT